MQRHQAIGSTLKGFGSECLNDNFPDLERRPPINNADPVSADVNLRDGPAFEHRVRSGSGHFFVMGGQLQTKEPSRQPSVWQALRTKPTEYPYQATENDASIAGKVNAGKVLGDG